MNCFRKNPFAQYCAEEEIEIIDDIFYKPRYYDSLLEVVKNKSSRFLLGQRGDGKSAVIYKLFNDLKRQQVLPILITRYDKIPMENNESYFLYVILQNLVVELSRCLLNGWRIRRRLSRTQKLRFAEFIQLFYTGDFADSYIACAREIARKKRRNKFATFFNSFLLRPINGILRCAVNVTADMIRNSIGLPDLDMKNCEYLQRLEPTEIKTYTIDEVVLLRQDILILILKELTSIAQTLGYISTVVLFDKIDEYKRINADSNKITEFCKDILTDTDLLLSENISIVFSLWRDIKHGLNNEGVRFDKFSDIDVRLKNEELIALIDKRLSFFSLDPSRVATFEGIVPDAEDRKTILELANRSPRTLIRILGTISDESASDVNFFSRQNVSDGLLTFCKRFDYVSLRPNIEVRGKKDMTNWIEKFLQLKKTRISQKDVIDTYGKKMSTSKKYIDTFVSYGLVKGTEVVDDSGNVIYEVSDPRIAFLISRGITTID